LESALWQTCSEIELIVVDDASTDNTYRVATSLVDPRVKVIRQANNRGVSAALNTGIQAARGEFIAILEHDDLWLPHKLARQLPLFSQPEVGLVYCGVSMIDASGNESCRVTPTKRGDIYRDLLFKSYITTSSTIIVRRECFERVGYFDEGLRGLQDYDMCIRIARHYYVDYVAAPLVQFAAYHHARLNSPSRLTPMYDRLNAKFGTYDYPFPLLRRRVLAYRHYTLAGVHGVNGDSGLARHEYLRSLAFWPFNPKCWLGLSAAWAGPVAYSRYAQVKTQLLAVTNRLRAGRA
jgi:glycosyltransferase involved in cell wall biosynthesis